MNPPWLQITDKHLSSEALVTEIAARTAARTAELGNFNPIFPELEMQGTPMVPGTEEVAPHLYNHLKQLHQTPLPDTEPLLAESPATQLPLIGRLWGLLRGSVHGLIMFYVGRHVGQQAQRERHQIAAIQALTQLTVQQEKEIARLKARLDQLESAE